MYYLKFQIKKLKKFIDMQLILIELNEINFKYVKKYFNNLKIDTLKKINEELIHTVSESEHELLEPWIQWHSIHTGNTAEDHGIFRLGDAVYSKKKQIFEELEQEKLKVGSISAMNTINNLKNPSYFIPDPWTETQSDKNYFSKIITDILRDTVNNNASGKFKFKNYFNLILIIFRFVRIKKYKLFLKIIINSFFGKWRKALFLDLLIHEIHFYLLKKHNPNFSCVFYNAGAHIQHHYLLNSLANETSLKNPEKIIKQQEDPFKEMLIVYDQILKDYIDNYENIIVATGLTQKIINRPHHYYRLINHEKFLKKINLNFLKVEPRMSRDFLIKFNNNEERDIAYETLNNIRLNNKIFFGILDLRNNSIFVTLTYSSEINKDDFIVLGENKINVFYEIAFVALKNAEHDGTGYLFATGEILEKFDKTDKVQITDIKNKIKNFFIKNPK